MSALIKRGDIRTLSSHALASLQGFTVSASDTHPDFANWPRPRMVFESPPCAGHSQPLNDPNLKHCAPALIDGATGEVLE